MISFFFFPFLSQARNLCYMISKREKTKRQLFNMKEAVFRAQLKVLTDPELNLSARDAERVRQMARFSSIYSDHSHRSSLSSKPQRENLFTLENLKTPKDHEEENEKAKEGEKASGKNPSIKKEEERKLLSADGNSQKKDKKEIEKLKTKDVKSAKTSDGNMDKGKIDDESDFEKPVELVEEVNHLTDVNDGNSNEETSSKSRLGKVSLNEIEEKTETGEPGDTKAIVEEPDSPGKKRLIPSDLQKKLTSILQSKTIMQKRREKQDSFSESLHIDVENSDSETASPEIKAEVALPVEERMNLFDQFSTKQELATKMKSPNSKKKKEATLPPVSMNVSSEIDHGSEVMSPTEEDTQEKRWRHSSHKKAKRRKHNRSSHKHKRPRRSPSLDAPYHRHLSISPIIIKTEGDKVVSKQSSCLSKEPLLTTTKKDIESPLSPGNSESLSSDLHSDFQSLPSFSKSARSSKKKRSRRNHSSDSIRSSDRGSSSPNKMRRHRHQSPLSSPHRKSNEQYLGSRKIQVTEHAICLEDQPSPNKEESSQSESKGRLSSKLRLKKQLSPVKGVVSYEVVKDDEVKMIPDEDMKLDEQNKGKKDEDFEDVTQCDVKVKYNHYEGDKDDSSSKKPEETESKHILVPSKKNKDLFEKGAFSEIRDEKESESKRGDTSLRTRHCKLEEKSVSKIKEESADTEKSDDLDRLNIVADHPPEKRRTRRHQSHQASVDDSSDENYRPGGQSPKVSPGNKQHRPRRLRTRRQLHPDETDGDEDDEGENSNGKGDSEGESIVEKERNATKQKTVANCLRSNGVTRRGIKLKSPLPDKPELNKLLLDPDKLIVESSLRKRIGERLASSIKGRKRWRTIDYNQPTLDKFVKRTNSCENVFSKPNIVLDSNVKRLSLPLARSDLSPLSVNKSSSVVNSTQGDNDALAVSNLGSPVKSPSLPTNVIFGAHSSPRGSLNAYRIPRRSQNSSLSGRLKDHNSPLDGLETNCELSSTTSSNTDSVFGGAEKLQRPGLRRQLSFENIGSHGDNPDLSAVVNSPSKCDTSKLNEDHLDGTQSYRSPSPVSSITSVASSRLGKLQAGKGDYEEDEEENTPTKRITRSQILEDVNSPSTRLRSREVIVKPPKLTLS